MSDTQKRMLEALSKQPMRYANTTRLAGLMQTSRVAVVQAGRALERKGLVVSFRSDNSEHASLVWALAA